MSEQNAAGEIRIFSGESGDIRVQINGEIIWLTQHQMSLVFDTTPENVLMHLKNIFKEGDLEEKATSKDFLVVQQEGKRQVRRKLKHYDLDAIISVGYRVNFKSGCTSIGLHPELTECGILSGSWF